MLSEVFSSLKVDMELSNIEQHEEWTIRSVHGEKVRLKKINNNKKGFGIITNLPRQSQVHHRLAKS